MELLDELNGSHSGWRKKKFQCRGQILNILSCCILVNSLLITHSTITALSCGLICTKRSGLQIDFSLNLDNSVSHVHPYFIHVVLASLCSLHEIVRASGGSETRRCARVLTQNCSSCTSSACRTECLRWRLNRRCDATGSPSATNETKTQITGYCVLVQRGHPHPVLYVPLANGCRLTADVCLVREQQKIGRSISQKFGSLHNLNIILLQ
jgi:hypothetical protein